MAGKPLQFSSPQEWLERYSTVSDSGCRLFRGGLDKKGYGKVGFRGRTSIASRASYEMFNGAIPPDLFVLHRCDVPRCINPEHLFLGTQADNIADMMRKNRQVPQPKKSECKNGHVLIVPKRGGQKICPLCQRAAKQRFRARLLQRKMSALHIGEQP